MTLIDFLRTDSTAVSLLAAVRDRPADDAPRVILADCVQEAGFDEWAEFVRVQCELARIDADCPDRNRTCRCDGGGTMCGACRDERDWNRDGEPLEARAEELLGPHSLGSHGGLRAWEWFGGIIANSLPETSRGFVSELTVTAEHWIAHGDEILAHPMVVGPTVELSGWLGHRAEYHGSQAEVASDWWFDGDSQRVSITDRTTGRTGLQSALASRWPGVREWILPTLGTVTLMAPLVGAESHLLLDTTNGGTGIVTGSRMWPMADGSWSTEPQR